MCLYNIIEKLNLIENNRPQMYSSIKLISNYIKGELSKFTKLELKKCIEGLKYYLKNRSNSNNKIWNFIKSGSITLDDEQHEIVISSPNQNQRIIAGAGSGKTTTILCRIKYLLDNWICPDRILVLTFNRDSAQNIRNRINDLFGFPINLNIYTIDAFCCKLMYMYKENEGIKSLSEYSSIGLEIMKLYGKEISTQFNYIFFDEFQDINDIQFNILKIFVDNGSWLSVIGDDCQNIYQFRGTNNYYMINYDIIIPNSNTYKLTTNYRSTKLIVNMANDSISWNSNRIEKKMKSFNNNIDIKPKLIICGSDYDKYNYIIKKIKKLIEIGYEYSDIAILSRNTYPLKCMETELTKNFIPHIALITDKNSDNNKRLIESGKLALTTIHKSKGLEFEIVFMLNFSHKHFPEHLNNNIKNIEEERRLFYVGITRTKKYLFMISSIQEIPLSIFLKEIAQHILISYYKTNIKYSRNELFNISDIEPTLKLVYGVNELISTLQSDDYDKLRKQNLVLNLSPDIKTIFESKLEWLEEIKKGAFEPDLGEYTDRYITRGICSKLNLDFIDIDTEFIIYQDLVSFDYNNLDKIIIEPTINLPQLKFNNNKLNKMKKDNQKNYLIKKILEQNIIHKFSFPQNVINKIKLSYQNIQNISKTNNELEEDIYWISLCRNFRLERTRLSYRNIYKLFKENIYITLSNDTIKSRMEYYINKYGSLNQINLPKCKISLEHKFKNNLKKNCSILGELDIIIWDDIKNEWILIDFKCSESDFRLEWQIQLLTYYSLIKFLDIYPNLNIKQIGIINIMDGKEYYFNIPPDYNFIKLIEYFEEKIKVEQLSIRSKPNLNLIISNEHIKLTSNNNNIYTQKTIIFNNKTKKIFDYIMVLDTETTDFSGDVIQLAWVIVNPSDNYKIIKKSNKFILDRISTVKSSKIHNISLNKLRIDGIDFFIVMQEFINDLSSLNKIIGHNIAFDLRIIINNLRKFEINIIDNNNNKIINLFNNIEIICTKKLSNGLSLENLYLNLFEKKILGAHDAMTDVNATLECYIKLNKLNSQTNIIIDNFRL
jgi:DNA polymerase III epsilon subunit-like protein